jgi:2-dehydropantoate 2-reductase
MTILVIGPGTVGCTVAVNIQNKGREVIVLGKESHKKQLSRTPITFEYKEKSVKEKLKITTLNDLKENGDLEFEFIVLALKAHQTIEVLNELENIIPIDIPLISMQNGLVIEDILRSTSYNNIFGGVIGFYLTRSENTIQQTIDAGITLGKVITEENVDEKHQVPDYIKETIASVAPLTISENIRQEIWMNTLIHSIIDPICAMGNMVIGNIIKQKPSIFLAMWIWREFLELINKLGVKPSAIQEQFDSEILYSYDLYSYFRAKEVMRRMLEPIKNETPPMVVDIRNNKLTEIDYLNGGLLVAAQMFEVDMPINNLIIDTIKEIEIQDRKPGKGLLTKTYRQAIIEYM